MSQRIAVLIARGVLAAAVACLSTNTGFGQGVHVRAPFVRVDVFPGGVSVRAPFAAVDVPSRRYRYEPSPGMINDPLSGRPPVRRAMPTAQELARMDDATLFRLLRSIGGQLQAALTRFDTGARWQRYLRVPVDSIADPSVPPDARRDALAAAFERFNKIAADPQYGMIAGLPAFGAAQMVMAEMSSRVAQPERAGEPRYEELPPPDPSHDRTERSLLPGKAN